MVRSLRQPQRQHTPKESLRASALVVAYVVGAYWLTGSLLPRLLSTHPDINFYVVQPVIWGGLGVLAYHSWRRLVGRPHFDGLLTGIAVGVGIFSVSLLSIAGVLVGFVQTPVAQRIVTIPRNALFIVTLLVGVETARSFLYWAWREHGEGIAFIVTTVLFFVVFVPFAQWSSLDGGDAFLRILIGRWVPALALSALATWLVEYGGLGPSFGYRIPLMAFVWFSPVFPDLGWTGLLVLGALTPFVSGVLIKAIHASTEQDEGEPGTDEESSRWWPSVVFTAIGSLLIVALFAGSLGIRPFVVVGTSMEPNYVSGDVAIITESVDPTSLEIGDVVRYRMGDMDIVHRIVAIDNGSDGLTFTTQGDNVGRPDPLVPEANVEGRVIFTVPWIGWVALWLRSGR